MSFHLYTSNRLELLADKLAEVVSHPLPSPLMAETVVVQSPGMQQWISLQLARRLGIWANCRYPFPNTIINELFSAVIADIPDYDPFARELMTWRIMGMLPDCLDKPGFESIKNYLGDERGFLKTWQIARQIANIFDQYTVFRPDMICRWEAGDDDGWQAELWRLLSRGLPSVHRPALRKAFFEALRNTAHGTVAKLPPRISVFGISALPHFHTEIFAAISELTDVNLFLMNPSQEYWAEIRSEYEMDRTLRREASAAVSADELHFEKGNSLLASMGRLGRDFLGMIIDYNPDVYACFAAPENDSLLHAIQSDILAMVDRGAAHEEAAPRTAVAEDALRSDASLRIHSCHSPMREVEVLYDILLDLFNHDPDLEPRDILVMTPDIDTYAPFIRAIFESPSDESRRIPFSIADRHVQRESKTVGTFLALLDLMKGRFGAGRVLAVLECEDVLRRFNLQPQDMYLIHTWVRETRICWGIDGADRALRGLPDSEENTWRAGIERLLLGFAMPGRESMMFQDILPYDRMEGSESQVLGNFVAFLEELFSQVSMLTDSRTLKGWAEALSTMLDRLFLLSEDTEQDTQIVRSAVNRLSLIEDQSGFTGQIELAVVRSWLESVFREESGGRGFLTGRVTFCAMLPMRSIPFKVMCLIGMNDGAFPRAATAVGFDLISRHPRRGDRSQRIDDRYLFLESIISAREKLYISYTGQGIQDNSEIPPSVLVSELLDYVEQGFEIPEKQIRDYLVVRHRLQAFSPRYFQKGNTLFSYSDENCFASKALTGTRKEPVPFITGRLFEPEQAEKTVSLQDIMRFFDNPVRFLLTRRLCLTLYEAETVIVEREAFELAGLERYAIERRLCEWYLSGQDAAPLYRIIRAAGMLPHGEVGSAAFRKIIPGTARFVQRLRPYLQGEKRASCAVDIVCAGYRLVGQISDIWQGRLVRFRYGKITARDRLRAWLLHLVRAVSGDSSCRPRGLLIGKDTSFELQLLEDGRELLEQLVSLYDRGLTELTPFFPETSLAYVQALRSKKSHDEALKAAQRTWAGSDYRHGECEDPYYEFCFGRFDPFDQRFVELACSVYEPLLTHQKEVNP